MKLSKLVSVVLAILVSTTLIQVPVNAGTTPPPQVIRDLEVLEVQPGTSYDLTNFDFSGIFTGREVNLTQMSMPEFISKVEELNGKYDIVYIGNENSRVSYSALGATVTTLPQGGSGSKEYYSDNDITNRRANALKEFIDSRQLTIIDQSIVDTGSSLKTTKLYNNFINYVSNNLYPNFITVVTNTNSKNKKENIQAAFSVYNFSYVTKRPALTLNSQPANYNGTDASYQTDKSLGYNFDIKNLSDAFNMTVKLYIDINGDGIFKADDDASKSELVETKDNLNSDLGYTLNYHLPDSYVGLQPWKLEVTDNSTGAKSYVKGAAAFRAAHSGGELTVRLLQLKPNGNTLSVYSLGQTLLFKDRVYRIDVTEMNVTDFNAAYANLQTNQTPLPKPATVNGVSKVGGVNTTAPTILNGNYDMVIMGFADIYGGNDITNIKAIQALQSFINTNQSVMFTHDTLTFQVNSPNTWGYNLTQNFRSFVGQQRYYRTAPDNTRYYDPMPYYQKDSYGFSNLTLGRYNGSKLFQTTTKARKVNDNLVTQFPYVLGDIQVAPTHFQYFQLDLEDENVIPIYTLINDSGSTIYNHPGDGRNDYYTYTKGTITYSGTGHSVPNGLPEKQMFVNTMMKAIRGANHAPTLEVNGISNGMDLANSLTSIDFSFTATDIDLNEPYLNADIYLSTSNDGTMFSAYQKVKEFSAVDPDWTKRISSGVAQSVSIAKAVDATIKAYQVKIVASDSYQAEVSKELRLNNKQNPQISVQSYSASCLVGDTLNIPVNVSAQATELKETFKNIKLQGTQTKPSGAVIPAYSKSDYPELTFNPTPSWNTSSLINQVFPVTFSEEGTHTLLNKLTYTAYNGVPPTSSNGMARENNQTFSIQVGSGTLEVEVLDMKGRGISGISLNAGGRSATTNSSGYASFTGLGTGRYTVTVTVPEGRAVVGGTSQTVDLSASTPYKKISFPMDGNLIVSPKITTRSGDSQMSIIKGAPLPANVGFTLQRPATFLNLDFNNTLSGSTMNVVISKVYRNNEEISFIFDSSNPKKLLPSLLNTSFPSGAYTVNATITTIGGTIQAGQNFTVSLTRYMSAKDANTGSEEAIAIVPASLKVNVVSAPKLD